MTAVAFCAAAAVGAVLRYLVNQAAMARAGDSEFPWGTFAVNTTGSFVAGVLAGVGGAAHLVLATGFCGAFTTFSSFAVETARLGRREAVFNVAATVVACAAFAAAGLALATA